MTIRIKYKKLHPNAKPPLQATDGAAAFDLFAAQIHEMDLLIIGTGLAIELPKDSVGLLAARSSVADYGLLLSNGMGILDSNYRGEVLFKFYRMQTARKKYEIGDRIGQIIIVQKPEIIWKEVETLTPTLRGAGGYGSTGK
jgi:dUTP pyrophosphatase